MRQEIDIDELMADTWLTVAQLRHGSAAPDGLALYACCCAQVNRVRDALAQAGYAEDSIDHITYAQCALLDETVMSRTLENGQPDEGHKQWKTAPLQARFFGSLQAGEALYNRIADVMRHPTTPQAVLTCYHRVLTLGFQGVYGVNATNSTQRDGVLNALNKRVTLPEAAMPLVIHGAGRRRCRLLRSVWFWLLVTLIVVGLVWWGGHSWLQTLLAQQLPELQ